MRDEAQAMKLALLTGNRDRRRHGIDWTVRPLLWEPRHGEHIRLERVVREELAETPQEAPAGLYAVEWWVHRPT